MRDAVRDLLGKVSTPSVPGDHYVHKAVAALAAGVALGVPAHNLASALGSYTGVKRRLQLKGEAAGVQVIDSYAGLGTGGLSYSTVVSCAYTGVAQFSYSYRQVACSAE